MSTNAAALQTTIRPLAAGDLDGADAIMRHAFGTFLGLPDPNAFAGDADYVRTRFAADPTAAFAAEVDGELAGSNFATTWGTVGFFGPLTVSPELWDRGIGARLIEPVMARFAEWDTRHAGLFTFAHSPKHVALYQRFGFWPGALTAIMELPVPDDGAGFREQLYSLLDEPTRAEAIRGIRALTEALYPGLDPSREIEHVTTERLGETILLHDAGGITAVAICHCGAGSEAGGGTCFVKFGAARPGPTASKRFDQLLDTIEAFARARQLTRIVAGTNVARLPAYQAMQRRGYRAWLQGITMHRASDAGYHRQDVYVIDDWR